MTVVPDIDKQSGKTRKQCMVDWLQDIWPGSSDPVLVTGDASFRSYYRTSLASETRIIMDAPPNQEDCKPFVQVTERLLKNNLRAPEIYHIDWQQGFLLLEDFGDQTLLSILEPANVKQLYGLAIESLLLMQSDRGSDLPVYDGQKLMNEMALFPDWLLTAHLGWTLSVHQQTELNQVFESLAQRALAQSKVFVHRDYHSRNLMLLEADESVGILDFQDAVAGPITYDLVSLLKDCYVAWPAEQISVWAKNYWLQAKEKNLPVATSLDEFMTDFHLMGVQRHLKAAGIFARLYRRDGKSGYLADIPRTLDYILQVIPTQPGLAPLEKVIVRVMEALD